MILYNIEKQKEIKHKDSIKNTIKELAIFMLQEKNNLVKNQMKLGLNNTLADFTKVIKNKIVIAPFYENKKIVGYAYVQKWNNNLKLSYYKNPDTKIVAKELIEQFIEYVINNIINNKPLIVGCRKNNTYTHNFIENNDFDINKKFTFLDLVINFDKKHALETTLSAFIPENYKHSFKKVTNENQIEDKKQLLEKIYSKSKFKNSFNTIYEIKEDSVNYFTTNKVENIQFVNILDYVYNAEFSETIPNGYQNKLVENFKNFVSNETNIHKMFVIFDILKCEFTIAILGDKKLDWNFYTCNAIF